jgi:Rps23 Pro-64 3,4-dihydroxylase Tpa1-like proline 4-hydroxylase
MPDPITIGAALSAANMAFSGIKKAVQTGREIQDCAGQLSKWASAMSDITYLEQKAKEKPSLWQTMRGSVESAALEAFAAKQQADHLRSELKSFISFAYGPSAWKDLVKLEGQIRKERKEQLYRKQEALDTMLSWTIGILLFLVGVAVIGGGIWFIGKMQGRW